MISQATTTSASHLLLGLIFPPGLFWGRSFWSCDVRVGLLTIVCAQAVEYPRQG